MITKLKARLSNAKSSPLQNTKNTGSDDEDAADEPSLMSTLSATLTNPKRLIGQEEMVHAILLGIQGTNKKLYNKSDAAKMDLDKLSTNELQKMCKTCIKIECPFCGSDNTQPHKFTNFDFNIYAPFIFESLRIHFNVQTHRYSNDFLYKLCGISTENIENDNKKKELSLALHTTFWKTLITNSKSGQLFYKTKDSVFIIKSMSTAECKFLRNNLHKYYKHMISNKDSLLCGFLGLYRVNIQYQKAVFVLIQKSVLYSYPNKLKMNKLYDLKGSTFGRLATRWKVEMAEDDMEKISNSIRNKNIDSMVDEIKDIDYTQEANETAQESHFDEQFSPSFYIPDANEAKSLKSYKSASVEERSDGHIDEEKHQRSASLSGAIFKRSKILKDLDFLKDKQAIFIGRKRSILWLSQLEKDTDFLTELGVMDYSLLMGMHYKEGHGAEEKRETNNRRWIKGELFHYDHGGMSYNELDENVIEETNEDLNGSDELSQSWSDENNLKKQLKNCIYFAGIIDILQPYNARKKAEHFLLGFKTDKSKVSAVGPEVYAKRLVEFMTNAMQQQ